MLELFDSSEPSSYYSFNFDQGHVINHLSLFFSKVDYYNREIISEFENMKSFSIGTTLEEVNIFYSKFGY